METSDIEVCKVSTTPEIHEGENRQENFINNEHDDEDKKCSNLKQFNDKEMIQNEQIQENEYQMVNYTGCPNQLINDDNSIIVNDSLKQQKQQNDKINRTVIRNTKTTTTTTSCNNDNKFQFRTPQQFIHRKSTSWKKSWKKQSKSRQKNNHNHHQNNHQQQQQQQQQQPQQQQQDGIENCCPQQNLKNHNNHHHQHHQHHNRNYYYHQMIANNHQKNKQQQQKNNNCKQQQQQQQQQKNNNCKQQQQKNNNNCKQQQLHCNDKKTLFKRITQHTLSSAFSSLRSKFFLPPKRPRKEIIIPPTKFLLGGNISDPLNLNSLQDEASNSTTPNATPKQSPITTPPKVEVIIPPNINDPLHLLDPVDSTEYEKQLVSPMKRKSKHRHRKKRPKHNNNNNNNNQTIVSGNICDISGISTASSSSSAPVTPSITSTTTATATTTITTTANCSGVEDFVNFNESNVEHIKSSDHSGNVSDEDNIPSKIAKIDESGDGGENKFIAQTGNNENSEQIVTSSNKKECEDSSNKWNNSEREKIKRDLRLNLTLANAHQQQQQQHNQVHSANGNFNSNMGNSGGGGGGGRKRKISEGPNSVKNKSRRLDSLDKIVSPVVPQPGAWKRPPRTIPSGGRKNSRVRSTSASENELISPTEEIKTIESESTRVDTPDIENNKQIGDFTSVSSSSDQQNKITEEKQQDNQDLQQQQQQQEDEQEKEQSVTVDVPKKFKPENAKYQYGNYDNYGYRRNLNEFSDVRLQVFKRHPDLFRGKDILDIGCNSGHMTISVAQKLAPKSILGIDIDSKLIEKARKNLSLYVRIPKDVDYNNHHSKYHHRHHHHHHDHHEKCQEHQHQQQQQQQNQIKEEKDQKTDQAEQQQEQQQQQQSSDIDCLPSSSSSKENPFPTLPASSIPLSSFEQSFSSLLNPKKKKKKRRSKVTFASKYEVNRNELFPISFPICYGGIPDLNRIYENHQSTGCNCNCGCSGKDEKTTATATTTTVKKSKQFKNEFPNNVFFRVTNYVLPDETLLSNDTQQYDLIICLSVTKWIHLNFGDVGLKLAFKRMFNQLRPGGKLILEAQNWASYKKRKNLTEKICENYKNMEFFPDDFHEYLLSNEVGFSHAYTLDVPRHKSKGFSRPIQLYAKGDFTPSHIRWSDNYHPQITPYEAYRGIYAACPHAPQHPPWNYDTTPHGNGGNFNCLQTPMYQPTSQYYNPLETDTYLPSYDTEVLNRHYVFASPLYQTVWSPPASLRNSSSHTPLFGSVREYDIDDSGGGGSGSGGGNGVGSNNNGHSKHVYPPSYDEGNSPQVNSGGAFNSIREVDPIDENCSNNSNRRHVYALATSTNYVENNPSSSPHPLPTSSSSTSSSHQHQQMFDNTVTSSSSETIDCSNSTTTITTPITTNQSDFTDQHHHQHDSSSN